MSGRGARGEGAAAEGWDFVHCPPWAEHVFIGAGDGPCAVLAVGTRLSQEVVYPASELAQRHRAGVERTTLDPKEAYAGSAHDVDVPFQEGWLPEA